MYIRRGRMLPEQNHTSYIKFCMIRPAFLNLPADVLPTNILFHSANFFLLNRTVLVLLHRNSIWHCFRTRKISTRDERFIPRHPMGKMLFIWHPHCRPPREGTLDSSGDSVAETTGSKGSASTGKVRFLSSGITLFSIHCIERRTSPSVSWKMACN